MARLYQIAIWCRLLEIARERDGARVADRSTGGLAEVGTELDARQRGERDQEAEERREANALAAPA
jgi:hypothetical protein